MARLVFAMNVSLDGYVDHTGFAPGEALFRHWIDVTKTSTGSLYGTNLYEIMRYWDTDDAGWSGPEREFAEAWRAQPKWVVSRSLSQVGPNATLLRGDLREKVENLKAEHDGVIDAGGPVLTHSLGELGLIDEYRLYLHPVVLGKGAPFFAGVLPRLKLMGEDRMGDGVIRLTYVPA